MVDSNDFGWISAAFIGLSMFSFTRHLNAQSGFSNDDVKQRLGQVVESIELTQPGERKMGDFLWQKFSQSNWCPCDFHDYRRSVWRVALVKDSLLVFFLNEVSNKDFARATKSALTVGHSSISIQTRKQKNGVTMRLLFPSIRHGNAMKFWCSEQVAR